MIKNLKLIAFLIFIFAPTTSLFSQVDTDFWFAAAFNTSYGNTRDRPINIWVTTLSEDAEITVSQPANKTFIPITKTVPAYTTEVIELTSRINSIQCTASVEPQQRGLHMHSTTKITAYFEQNSISNPDIFALKGGNALGNDFIIPSQTDYANCTDQGWLSTAHTFVIVAIYDGTLATIIPTHALTGGHAANVPFTISMNKGETFVCQSTSTAASGNLAGSSVSTNNHPVAITVNDDSMKMYDSGGGGISAPDLGGDQIIPIGTTGKEYVIVKGYLENSVKDRVYVTGITDNTVIKKNDVAWKTIDANETESYAFSNGESAIYLSADTNYYVWHVSGYSGQPAAAIVPPIKCTGSDTVAFTRSTPASPEDANFALLVITKAGHEDAFKVKGSTTLLTASDFFDVPGTSGDWRAARKSYSNAQMPFNSVIDIINTEGAYFHVGVLNGNSGNSCRYGYFSNFDALNLGNDRSICIDSETTLDAGNALSYLWNTGEQTQSIEVETGKFWVEITKEGCDRILRDTIEIFDTLSLPTIVIPNPAPMCQGFFQTLDAGAGFNSYEWNDDPTQNQQTIEVSTPDEYWVKVSNDNNCFNADTVTYSTLPKPAPNTIKHN